MLWCVYKVLFQRRAWIEKRYNNILLIFLCTFAVIQLLCAWRLEFTPKYDLGAVFESAVDWAEEGGFPDRHEYFYYFPNNLGCLLFLYCLFKPAYMLGIKNYFAVASVANCICILLTMFVSITICKKTMGTVQAVFMMILFAICLPFYFMAAAFYTDSLSLLYPVLEFYLYLKIRESKGANRFILWSILLGITAAFGMQVKFTIIIMLIAIVIDSFLNRSLKQTAAMLGIVLGVMVSFSMAFSEYFYTKHLDRDMAYEMHTPYAHWIMMGLKGDGGYTPEDYIFTRSFPAEIRDQEVLAEAERRFTELDFKGLCELAVRKIDRDFGTGTLGLQDFLDDEAVNETWLHDWILWDSPNFNIYQHYCHSILLAGMILMSISAFSELKRKPIDTVFLAPRMSLFGLVMFLLIWESHPRYFSNYMPVILMNAAVGMEMLRQLAGNRKKQCL